MLSDVYDALRKALACYGCPAEVYLGGQYSSQHTSPLRVILIPAEDGFAPPNASVLGSPANTRQGINPRPIATRSCGVRCELWATAPEQRDPSTQYRANLAYLDALVNTALAALQQITPGITITSGGAPAENNVDSAIAGLGYVLSFSVDTPVFDAPWPAQQLSECSKTWTNAPATADVTVSARLGDPPTFQPGNQFPIPTAEA